MNHLEKIRIVFIPYLLACLFSIVGLGLFRWLFEIKLQILKLDEIVFLFIFPIVISLLVALTIVRRRIETLWITWQDRKGYQFWQFYCGFMLFGMLAFSQYFVSTASFDLVEVSNVGEISTHVRSRYYSLKSAKISTTALEYADTYTSGKYGQTLNFRISFACEVENANGPKLFWYGVQYHDNIRSRESSDRKEAAFRGFIDNSRLKFNNYKFSPPLYYEDIQPSGVRRAYYNAIAQQFDIPIEKLFMLEPRYEPFGDRYKNSLLGFLIAFCLGHIGFLIIVLRSKINDYTLTKFRNGTLVINDDLIRYTKYLVPRKPHFQTSVLIDAILIYHFVIVITGADILSPLAYELYQAGGITASAFADGEYWRLLTSMFIHSGVIHLFNNVFALGVCGYLLEKYTKSCWFMIVYLICGVLSTFVSLLWHADSVLVGASGAIFGLYGLMIAFLIRKIIPFEEKALYFMALVFFAGISMVMGFVLPNVNNAAHVAGLITGVLIGFFVPTKPSESGNAPTDTVIAAKTQEYDSVS